jgi:hypothetical protein
MHGKSVLTVLFFTLFLLSLSAHGDAAGPDVKEGKWEITTEIKIAGMPEGMGPGSFVTTKCLAGDNAVPLESLEKSGQDCSIEDVRTDGNTVRWKIRCSSEQGEISGEGKLTYRGETFEGQMNLTTPGGDMTQKMKGRYVGACE